MTTGQEFEITVDQEIDNGSTDMAATARRHLKSVPEQTSYLEDTAGFLEYLGAVAREVQSKPTRDFHQHEDFVTLDDVPGHSKVHVGPTESHPEWLRVPKLQDLARPELPEEFEGLVDVRSLDDHTTRPVLNNSAVDLFEEDDADVELIERFDAWLASTWDPWALKAAPIRDVRRFYQALHAVSLEAERTKVSHELVWGHGMFAWKGAEKVVSPLLVTEVKITFDKDTGLLSVIPNGETRMELDAVENCGLDALDPFLDAARNIEQSTDVFDPWDLEALATMACHLMSPLGVDARFVDDSSIPAPTGNPVMTPSWAFFLRKRPKRHERFYKELSEVIQTTDYFPEALGSMLGVDSSRDVADESSRESDSGPSDRAPSVSDQRLLMPLAVNDEQARIAKRLAGGNGVAVQGPPGTGKSHTIANLVSHLIAHGNRVLVTAENEQALSVLMDKLPDELRPLVVSVLGSSSADIDKLQTAVKALLEVVSNTDVEEEQELIAELEARVDELRETERLLDLKMREAGLGLNDKFTLTDLGTVEADAVARWVTSSAIEIGLIDDSISADDDCPISQSEFVTLLDLAQELSTDDIAEAQRVRPAAAEIPSASEVRAKHERLDMLRQELADIEAHGIDMETIDALGQSEIEEAAAGLRDVSVLLGEMESGWLSEVRELVVTSSESADYWNAQVSALTDDLREAHRLNREITGHRISVPARSFKQQSMLLDQIERIFAQGKKIPKIGKRDLRDFYESISLDDDPLMTVDDVQLLRQSMQLTKVKENVQTRLEQLHAQASVPVPDLGPTFIPEADVVLEKLAGVMAWESTGRSDVENQVKTFFNQSISISVSTSEDAEQVANVLDIAVLRSEERDLTEWFDRLSEWLTKGACGDRASEVWSSIDDAVTKARFAELDDLTREVARLEAIQSNVDTYLASTGKLREVAPLWTRTLSTSDDSLLKKYQSANIHGLWEWAQARTWLLELNAKTSFAALLKESIQVKAELESRITDIVRRSASVFLTERMDDRKRQALVQWTQAVAKIGKRTGKNWQKWEAEARRMMPRALGAIPVWVMPIHRVIQNFDPRKSGLFDVVIVDESSQCDLLSAGVLALAHKAIVVGDDKQIQPYGVGVNQDRITSLQDQYISNIDAKRLMTIDDSLYNMAERAFGEVVMLKEHFRCVPEIIGFSNRYYGDKILPMRESSDGVLGAAVRAVHVEDAPSLGTAANKTNRVEAETLVAAVVDCIQDPAYEGKSMGVVSLVGNAQGQLITNMLREELGYERFMERRMRVGGPADFQGDERDVIFISVVADDGSYSATDVRNARRLNVAASRARDQLWVFHSVDPEVLHPNDHRRALIEYAQTGGIPDTPAQEALDMCESDFERDVLRDVVAKGFRVTPQHQVGTRRIDLVAEGPAGRIAVECDGDFCHTEKEWDDDIRRQRQLERLGWQFWRIRASEYYLDQHESMKPLWSLLQSASDDSEVAPTVSSIIEEDEVLDVDDRPEQFNLHFEDHDEEPVSEIHDDLDEDVEEPDIYFGDDATDGGIFLNQLPAQDVSGIPMGGSEDMEPVSGVRSYHRFEYSGARINIDVTQWDSHPAEVKVETLSGGGQNLARLLHGGRMGVRLANNGKWYADLTAMKKTVGSDSFPTAKKVSRSELHATLGFDPDDFLYDLGVDEVGDRADVIDDTSGRRTYRAATWFDQEDFAEIPVAIFVITRVLPLMALDGVY